LIEQEDAMAKKLKDLIKDEEMLASAVRTSAQQIWQAGLGAFAKAQQEGGRVFNKLVEEGTEFQKRSRAMAEDRVGGMSDMVDKVADGFGKQASGSWDKLEQVFEDRVSRALGSIGVPTRKDIEALTRQLEELRETVARLAGEAGTPAARRAVKTAARKPAVKKSVPRKRAAKTPAP
jgi:poly(hydroxyalkanoate) granule-associated protein